MQILEEFVNSTCLPSGDLVDGLPLYGCKVILIRIRPRVMLYFFLPCDPAGKIISSYNDKVYRSEVYAYCENSLCVNIKVGDSYNSSF